MILREEETEITDIEETSITELKSDLSPGFSNRLNFTEFSFFGQ